MHDAQTPTWSIREDTVPEPLPRSFRMVPGDEPTMSDDR